MSNELPENDLLQSPPCDPSPESPNVVPISAAENENSENPSPDLPPEDTHLSDQDELTAALHDSLPHEWEASMSEQSANSLDTQIEEANRIATGILDQAKLAIINIYSQNELKRIERQQPLLNEIIKIIKIQLWAFNIIILLIGIFAFVTSLCTDVNSIAVLFDIVKYYIGATIVELIAMLIYIAKGTFSDGHVKIMEEFLLGKRNKDDHSSHAK